MKVLYVVTEDWYFLLHRAVIARMARARGLEVVVVTRDNGKAHEITGQGMGWVPFPWRRRSVNPFTALSEVFRLARVYRRERPDIVHHIAVRPCITGSIAALFYRDASIINNFAGLGLLFGSRKPLHLVLRRMTGWLLKGSTTFLHAITIVENGDDREILVNEVGLRRGDVHLVAGIGVDVGHFTPAPEPAGIPVVTLVGRMLRAKGIEQFVEAVRLLRADGIALHARLVGTPDPGNPDSLRETKLRAWHDAGLVEWTGYRDDIVQVIHESLVVVLPTYYREGVPRSLLEAAACGRAMVASDIPGCRDIVVHEETGLLVPPRNAQALADAIARLLQDPRLRAGMGEQARRRVEEEFSEEAVVNHTWEVYQSLLANRP